MLAHRSHLLCSVVLFCYWRCTDWSNGWAVWGGGLESIIKHQKFDAVFGSSRNVFHPWRQLQWFSLLNLLTFYGHSTNWPQQLMILDPSINNLSINNEYKYWLYLTFLLLNPQSIHRVLSKIGMSKFPSLKETLTAMHEEDIDSPYLIGALIDIYEEELASGQASEGTLDKAIQVCTITHPVPFTNHIPYISHIGMCRPKGYHFRAFLVWNGV